MLDKLDGNDGFQLDKLGLPIGIQLIANAFDEPGLISTAHVLEKSADFNFIADGVAK